MLPKRPFYPCCWFDMVPSIGRNLTEICLILSYAFKYVYNRFNHLISSWKQDIFQPNNLHYITKSFIKREPRCKIALDLLVERISRPKINQNIVYNSHERVHDIKFQSFTLINGLIGNLSVAY